MENEGVRADEHGEAGSGAMSARSLLNLDGSGAVRAVHR